MKIAKKTGVGAHRGKTLGYQDLCVQIGTASFRGLWDVRREKSKRNIFLMEISRTNRLTYEISSLSLGILKPRWHNLECGFSPGEGPISPYLRHEF